MENNNLIELLNVKQVSPGIPIYKGICNKCGETVEVIETGAAYLVAKNFEKRAINRTNLIWIGAITSVITVIGLHHILFNKKEKEKD